MAEDRKATAAFVLYRTPNLENFLEKTGKMVVLSMRAVYFVGFLSPSN